MSIQMRSQRLARPVVDPATDVDRAQERWVLRPVYDMEQRRDVREVCLRTVWDGPAGAVTAIDVVIERRQKEDDPAGRFRWHCDAWSDHPGLAAASDPGIEPVGVDYDTPIDAYHAAMLAIGSWLDAQ